MTRVLVPLDGSDFSASIIPDAIRLAGPAGELVLVRDASLHVHDDLDYMSEVESVAASESYLEGIAAGLRETGISVRTETLVLGDPASAVDTAAKLFEVDAIACATHARAGWQSLIHPSIAWRALANS